MRALSGEQAHAPVGVAEGDQILAEEAHLLGRAIRRRQLGRRQGRHPVLPQQFAHGRAAPHSTQELVVLSREHGASLQSHTAKAIPQPVPASER